MALSEADLQQDEDLLDTWFCSWLWPMHVLEEFQQPANAQFLYFYPTNALVTAPETIFFWVTRMITAGDYFHKRNVHFTCIGIPGVVLFAFFVTPDGVFQIFFLFIFFKGTFAKQHESHQGDST